MDDKKLYPLTLPQEAFYYDYLLHRNDCKYNMGGIFILEGELNVDLYERAFNYVAKCFDAMRIKFIKKDDVLYQLFKPEQKYEVKVYDFRNHINPIEDAFEFIFTEYKRPILIESEELCYEKLVQIEEKKWLIVPKFHHIVYDGAGRSIINQALSDTYNSLLNNNVFPELKTYSYIDFINDDQEYKTSELYKKSFEYWKEKLKILPEPLEFTSKKKSIKNIPLYTERITLNLHRICFESILNLGYENDATTFQVILGLLTITLARCYKQNEIIIGMPVLNRSNYKFRNTPGLFMNMMALKLSVNPNGVFEEILNSIKPELREGYRHQRFPLRDTIKYLRSNSEFNNELFDVTVIYRKNDYSQLFGKNQITTITLDTQIRTESLSVEIDEYGEEGNVNMFFNYNPLVIAEDEMTQFVRCFENVLLDLIHFPEKSINEINILNEFDSFKILNEFNQTAGKITTEKTIVKLFEETVLKYGANEAIIHNDKVVCYKELNEKANGIAAYLLSNYNIQKEEIICLVSNRSIDSVAAMLGIMKTGAAYLPIDIDLPNERIQYIIKNSGSRILINNGHKDKNFSEKVISLNEITLTPKENVNIDLKSNNLAYVIYTSGSTGKPKGVLIEHGNFTNMFVNMIGIFGIKEADRVLQFASIGFDGAMFEIFQALLTGATLVIADKDKIQSPELFIRYIEQKEVTFVTLPPAYLSVLDKTKLPSVHTLVTAGEQAIVSDVNYYKQFVKYINGYGPTENSVCTSYYIVEKDKEYSGNVPIGKPSPNSKIYILDENLKPVPVGFSGELCVSGSSITRGYLNNEELTNQKLVNNPFEPDLRMYHTGDLARWREDGNIEFLGRIDEQVKINGNRIELGEIENRLLEHSSVKEVVVLDIQTGNLRELAAFIVQADNISIEDIKKHLRLFLPEYMIPLHYVFLENIPITDNGKINKAALRQIHLNDFHKKTEFKSATSETEEKLIKMFEDILDVRPIGIDDNFFQLGGESLKIARLISLIYKQLKKEIEFKAIFSNPTVRGIAAELELKKFTQYEEIKVIPVKEYYSLSHAQKRLWILMQNKENSAVYNMPISLLLEGSLNLDLLENSLKIIIQRHESLHTIYIEIDGNPYQKVQNDYNFTIGKYDVSQNDNKDETASEIIQKIITKPFDLTFEIPIRVDLLKLGKNKHVLLLVINHIAGDGISIGIIMKELSLLYNSFSEGDNHNLKPLRIQYKDYCEYEQHLLSSIKYNEEKEYWLKKLHNPLPVLELVYNKPRPPIKTYVGNHLFYEIGKTDSQNLINFCKEQNVSLYVLFVSIVNILLHKYSSQEEIIIGSPVAGRNNTELEEQVGIYLNTIAVRNEIKGDLSFSDFLNNVKINTTEAISNSNYPFDLLINDLNIDRDTSHTPIFDVFVQLQNQNYTNLELKGITSAFYEIEFNLNKYDLTFTFVDEKGTINFNVGYNTDLFAKAFIDRMAIHIKNIIFGVIKNPSCSIKQIDYLDELEKENLIKIGSGDYKEYNKQITIAELFETQKNRTPNNIAVVFNDKKYTYEQLDIQSNIIAQEINLRRTINPDDIIAIMTNRSELMIFGILGIIKAGAAYMPIDPGYPAERISFMLKDSKAKMIITESDLINIVNEAATLELLKIELLDINKLRGINNKKPELKIKSTNLVYVIYTSGSTGKPKGVMIEHGSLFNLVLGLKEAIYKNYTTPLNIALISPFVFDASVKQIFFALLNGHCINIVPEEIKTNGRKLLEYYETHKIDVSDGTPNHLEIILEELSPETDKYLPNMFVLGGQQLMYQTVKKLFDLRENNLPVINNVYGPTECTDVSSNYKIIHNEFQNSKFQFNTLPIGKALNNVKIYILDANLNQVPVGVNGEICIAGDGLARGYLNRQELTDEKFINVNYLNTKVYKTGDVGFYLEDGNIILTGRKDDQIKLRGYRIELSEIENCIRGYKNIKSAAVIPVGEGNYQEIAAYYCASEAINSEDLKLHLAQYLPSYMIPSNFIELENLPLTINGKVDKKLLPLPVKEMATDEENIKSNDFLEERLKEIWRKLLNIKRINSDDNFFKLGGHSLIAIKLVSRIHKEFNIELNIWEIFKFPTILLLAKLLRTKNPTLFTPIEKIGENEYYELSHSQRRLWLLSKLDGQNSLYNLPAALLLTGEINIPVLESVFKAIFQRHESFRTYFVEIDGEPYQKIADDVNYDIEIEEYTESEWNENKLLELADKYFQNEFDLSKAPLLQIKLIKLSKNYCLLLINMHHIISDGWSIEVMLKEIEVYYDVLLNNTENSLLPLRIQYKDYAVWQNKILSEKSLEVIKEYWQNKLKQPRPILDLPSDYKRPIYSSVEGELLSYSTDAKSIKTLVEITNKQNASLFMALLSTVYILFYKYTGQEDIMIGSPVAGRQHYDLENQIGFFINTIVLRNEVNPEYSFEELLNKVKETLSSAFDNQVYPFDRLVDELDVERIQNRNPLFDVMVAWMVKNGSRLNMSFNGIEMRGLDFRLAQSMFELTFLFEENEGKVTFAIEYNTSLFKRERINRMSGHFNKLIDGIVTNPKEKIKNLKMILDDEKEQLLYGFNKTDYPLTDEQNVIEQYYLQVKLNKNNIAVVCDDNKITYDELNKLSNRIANSIVERVQPKNDDIIAVMVEDPIFATASLLAVMKTGAVYLPIMYDYPKERVLFILQNSNSKVLLTDDNIFVESEELKQEINGKTSVINVKDNLNNNHFPPQVKIQSNDLAYVIYTSGSTGEPKGVMIEHKSLSNLVLSLHNSIYKNYDNELNELMISSFAFDVSIKQIFAVLCCGKTLHILNNEKKLDPREIIKYIVERKINVIDLTPSLFAVMLEEGFSVINKPDIKEIFIGSESLPFKLIKEFFSNTDNRKINVTNFYGPTECCVESTYLKLDADMISENYDIVPIGKPIINEQIYILDKYLNLCPIGVPGEICIGGKGLARQYLNDVNKTKEKFIEFPFIKGKRVYKTGDVGRILSGGNIEFIGRMDEQIKIRGYRVELQEIEKYLRDIEGVNECVVTLFEKESINELTAYYTSKEIIDKSKIINYLERFLPKYMVPVNFIRIEKIPLSSNGKVNKKLLPEPAGKQIKKQFRVPQDEIESLIVRICSNVLKKTEINIDDNFFEIGGHSLNAVRVISQIQKELNVDLALKEIFYNPILFDIAGKVKNLIKDKEKPAVKSDENKAIVPISDEELELLSNLKFDDDEE